MPSIAPIATLQTTSNSWPIKLVLAWPTPSSIMSLGCVQETAQMELLLEIIVIWEHKMESVGVAARPTALSVLVTHAQILPTQGLLFVSP